MPEPVATEIVHRGQQDITARAIEQTDWLVTKPVSSIPTMITEWRLGAGESGVLALAAEHTVPRPLLMIWLDGSVPPA